MCPVVNARIAAHRIAERVVDIELVGSRSYMIPDMPFPDSFSGRVDLTGEVNPKIVLIISAETRTGDRDFFRIPPLGYELVYALSLPGQHQGVSIRHAGETVVLYLIFIHQLVFPDDISVPVDLLDNAAGAADRSRCPP